MSKSALMNQYVTRFQEQYPAFKGRLMMTSIQQAAAGVAALETLAATRSPFDTEGAHVKRVQAAAAQLSQAALRFESDVWNDASTRRDSLTFQIVEKSKLGPTPSGVELRAVLRGLDPETRLKVVSDALRGGDHELISAVLCAPSIASGVPDLVRTAY